MSNLDNDTLPPLSNISDTTSQPVANGAPSASADTEERLAPLSGDAANRSFQWTTKRKLALGSALAAVVGVGGCLTLRHFGNNDNNTAAVNNSIKAKPAAAPADPYQYAAAIGQVNATNVDGKDYKLIITFEAKAVDPANPDVPLDPSKVSYDQLEQIKNGVVKIRQEIVLGDQTVIDAASTDAKKPEFSNNPHNISDTAKYKIIDLWNKYQDWQVPAAASARTLHANLFMSYQVNAPISGGETWYRNDIPLSELSKYLDLSNSTAPKGYFVELGGNAGNKDKIAIIVLHMKDDKASVTTPKAFPVLTP